ncbi:MAG: sigma 54-interacting transcriptional regulator [Polyangiales bacterium]
MRYPGAINGQRDMPSPAASLSEGVDIPLQLWREICRHPEIGSALGKLMPHLQTELPLSAVLVRRLDSKRRHLETVGEERVPGFVLLPQAHQEYSEGQLDSVLSWCREGRVLHGRPNEKPMLGMLVPRGVRGDVIVGPLVDEEGPQGVFVLIADDRFSELHQRKAQGLLEPFRLALENDRRFHELARLREAVEADNRALRSRLERQDIVETIVGGDAGLKEVTERIEQVAATDVPVLVLGETGTGKEVVARAIHARSHRAKGPIVCVNCGAIPPGLVDSELFGHERGSFTGASGTRKGWFERADGGTLFLDEVGELPLDAQVRLLRVLQEHMFERVGGTRSIHVDVRVVAATHRNLEDMVQAGTFREDLWYRLSVFPMYLPPLRERQSDIPALAAHFAWRAGKRLGGTPLVPSDQDVELLLGYDWPGNVRELVTVIERAAILGGGKKLNMAAALGVRSGPPARQVATATTQTTSSPPPAPAERRPGEPFMTLDQAQARHIEHALEETHGRIEGKGGAAELLDINPHTLRSRMKKLGVNWGRFRA